MSLSTGPLSLLARLGPKTTTEGFLFATAMNPRLFGPKQRLLCNLFWHAPPGLSDHLQTEKPGGQEGASLAPASQAGQAGLEDIPVPSPA